MRVLSTKIHGLIDYLWGLGLIATPFLLGFAGGPAQWIAILFGAGAIAYSLVTDYELGLTPLIPMKAHLALDGIAGAVLAAAPWLFGFSGQSTRPFLAFGLFAVAASLITRTRRSNSDRLLS